MRTFIERAQRFAPALILLGAVLLRAWMVAEGGQYFFGDEGRYDRGVQLYVALAKGDFPGMRSVLAMPEHAMFPVVGAAVTAVQHLLAHLTPYGDWRHAENIVFTMWLGALVLSLFSTLNLFLTYRLARVAGADQREARWGLFLAAASNTLFYPARHLLPYSCALSAALLALIVGLRVFSLRRAFLCGMLAALSYHLYNGYWYLVPTVALAYCWWWRHERPRWLAPLGMGLGLCGGLFAPICLGILCGGRQYLLTMAAFSATVTQGLFAEGWHLPWEFLWHAEGILGIVVLAATAVALTKFRATAPSPVWLWLLILGTGYSLLVLFSNGLGRFVVYARTVLPFTPFFCLVGGWAVAILLLNRARLSLLAAGVVAALAAWQLQPHFSRVFPREIEIAVLKAYGVPKHSLSVTGSLYLPLDLPVSRPDLVLVNAQLLYPIRGYLGEPPGRTLLKFEHPLSYLPFQYESHTPAERAFLRSHDIAIRLIQIPHPDQVPDDLPWPLRFQNSDRPTGRER